MPKKSELGIVEEIAAEMIKNIQATKHPGTPEETGSVPSDSVCNRMVDVVRSETASLQ